MIHAYAYVLVLLSSAPGDISEFFMNKGIVVFLNVEFTGCY